MKRIIGIYINQEEFAIRSIECGVCFEKTSRPVLKEIFGPNGEVDIEKWRGVCGEHGCLQIEDNWELIGKLIHRLHDLVAMLADVIGKATPPPENYFATRYFLEKGEESEIKYYLGLGGGRLMQSLVGHSIKKLDAAKIWAQPADKIHG